MSLPISAPTAQCPYMAIVNAYWSPLSNWPVPVPDGPSILQWLFTKVVPWVFAWHAWPVNRLRREYGLAALPSDFRDVHISADYVLYPDVPEMTYYLAIALREAKQPQAAVTTFEEALREAELSSSEIVNARFYFDYGATADQAGLYDKAADLFKRHLSGRSSSPEQRH